MAKRKSKYIRIKNKIVKGIKDGSIKGKLPGERVLAKKVWCIIYDCT